MIPRMTRLRFSLYLVAGLLAGSTGVWAADSAIPVQRAAEIARGSCRCGHMQVIYVRHRELRATYGKSFDPRDYDRSEPRYFFGGYRHYARFCRAGGCPD